MTYEQAVRCPRCGTSQTYAMASPEDDGGERLVRCYCKIRNCSMYGRVWFIKIDRDNTVTFTTHTHEENPADDRGRDQRSVP